MDVGCYAVHGIRDLSGLLGGEPRVLRAEAGEIPEYPGVDAWLAGDLAFPNGVAAHLESSMTHGVWDFSLRIVGTRGEIFAPAFVLPQTDSRVIVTIGIEQRIEELETKSTYTYQLEALARLLRQGEPMVTDADDAVRTMETIDALYAAAGRSPHPVSTI